MKPNEFRALSDEMSPTWFYGDLVYDDGVPRIKACNIMKFKTCLKGTDGQFIGIKDAKDIKIYEDDILDQSKFPEDDPCPYRVIFEDGAYRKLYSEWDETLSKPVIDSMTLSLCDDVVIGNFHQNQELWTK